MQYARYIMIPPEVRKDLMSEFKVSRISVWKALTFRADTPLAQTIRKAAIERGGAEFDPDRRKRTN